MINLRKIGMMLLFATLLFTSFSHSFAQVPDTDGDGINDREDDCPRRVGPASRIPGQNGCPLEIPTETSFDDRDGDGTADNVDSCPDAGGPAWANGCPESNDSDGDEISNTADRCPESAGTAANNGCPPDSDGDGVTDEQDACPNLVGNVRGCNLPTIPEDEACSLATIDTTNVNIRRNPSREGAVDGQIPFTSIIPIIGFLENSEGRWYGIEQGWVFAEVVRIGGRCAELPEIDENRQAVATSPASGLEAWVECPENNIVLFTFVGAPNQQYNARLLLPIPAQQQPQISFSAQTTYSLIIPITNGVPLTSVTLRVSEFAPNGTEENPVEVLVDLSCAGGEILEAWVECPETNIVHFSFVGLPNRHYNARLLTGAGQAPNISFDGGQSGVLTIPGGLPDNPAMTEISLRVALEEATGKSAETVAEVLVDLTCAETETLQAWVECPENNIVYFNFVGAPNRNYNARLLTGAGQAPNISFDGGHSGALAIPPSLPDNPPLSQITLRVQQQNNDGTLSGNTIEIIVDLSCAEIEVLLAWIECPETNIVHFNFVGVPNRNYNARLLTGAGQPPNVSFGGGQTGILVVPASLPDNPPLTQITLRVQQQNNDGTLSGNPLEVIVDLTCPNTEVLQAWVECPENNIVYFNFVGAPNRNYNARLLTGNPEPNLSFSGGHTGSLLIPPNMPTFDQLTLRVAIQDTDGKLLGNPIDIIVNLNCTESN